METKTINVTNARWLTARVLGKHYSLGDISPDVAKPLEDALYNTLTQTEIVVLRLRFGLYDHNGDALSLYDVGYILGVTRERVRQIEMRAIRRLRHPSRSRRLREFVVRGGE